MKDIVKEALRTKMPFSESFFNNLVKRLEIIGEKYVKI
jgi:hypothetical protein